MVHKNVNSALHTSEQLGRKFVAWARMRVTEASKISSFRVKFTVSGGIGLFTSPPAASLELALRHAEDLQERYGATIERIVESERYFFLDRDGCTQLLKARSGRQ
jgi:hypothetical protein